MLNPLMLLGLLGVAGPIIIHLIQRQRLRPQPLATLRFLERQDVSNAFAPVPRDLLQLLLRLLLLVLFVLLMVRFTLTSPDAGPRSLVLILDNSMSTQRRTESGTTPFEQHKRHLTELIQNMGPKDEFCLMVAADRIQLETGFLRDRVKLLGALEPCAPSESGSRALYPAIQRALDLMQSRTAVNRAVLVFSDHQRAGYASHLADEEVRTRLADLQTDLLFVGETLPAAANLAVTDGAFLPQRAYLGTSAKLTARVTSFSAETADVAVTFQEEEAAGERRTLTLAPGQSAQIDLVHRFQSPADAACAAVLGEDPLEADNAFRLPMRLRERRQILLVASAVGGEEEEGRTTHQGRALFRYAVNPGQELGLAGGTQIRLKQITPLRLQGGDAGLALCSTVVLYGVDRLPEEAVQDLAAFVQNGGGLILIPERDVSPRRFNESFAPLLGGLRLGGLVEAEQPAAIDTREAVLGAELFLPLVRGEWGDVDEVLFTAYFRLLGKGQAACALRTTDGDWLGAVRSMGRGRVYLQTFSYNLADTSLPRTVCFVPMVQELLSAVGSQERNPAPDVLRAGDAHYMRVPEFQNLQGPVHLAGPLQRRVPLRADRSTLKVEGLVRAGHYKVTHPARQGSRHRWLCVNPVLGESDLTPLSAAEHANLFGTTRSHRLVFDELDRHFVRERELFPLLFWLVAVAFLAEALLGAWQAHRQEDRA